MKKRKDSKFLVEAFITATILLVASFNLDKMSPGWVSVVKFVTWFYFIWYGLIFILFCIIWRLDVIKARLDTKDGD